MQRDLRGVGINKKTVKPLISEGFTVFLRLQPTQKIQKMENT